MFIIDAASMILAVGFAARMFFRSSITFLAGAVFTLLIITISAMRKFVSPG